MYRHKGYLGWFDHLPLRADGGSVVGSCLQVPVASYLPLLLLLRQT